MSKVKKIIQIVALVREVTDPDTIQYMEDEAKKGVITAQYFYPIRDEHYDEGYGSGELVLLDGDTGELLIRTLVNLKKSVIKKFEKVTPDD